MFEVLSIHTPDCLVEYKHTHSVGVIRHLHSLIKHTSTQYICLLVIGHQQPIDRDGHHSPLNKTVDWENPPLRASTMFH